MFGGLNVWFHQNEDYNSWAYSALFSELAADSSTIVFSWNGLQATFLTLQTAIISKNCDTKWRYGKLSNTTNFILLRCSNYQFETK